ncbi:glycosyltransferase [Paenibacillus sp. NPDC058910]|uniref:glycosyltransferase n=1 Tax=unclassified Paenibacillus TaxID=185978 RepID=UPI0036C43A91
MHKLRILYFTFDWSAYTYKPDHYFKQILATQPDVHVHFTEQGGYLPEIIRNLDFTPDFIYIDNFTHNRRINTLPTGLNEVNIPKGILLHDVQRRKDAFRSYLLSNDIDLIFVHYRDAFHKYFPELRNRLRWMPNHVYKPIFHKYKVKKTIDYLTMGRVNKLYPLRKEIVSKSRKLKGLIIHEHPGYKSFTNEDKESLFLDEKYAEEICRAKMFLTCGSRYDFAVSKYFEVPACGTLLLASNFSELTDLGFKDKKNFISINKNNFLKKAKYYLEHEDERKKISREGYKLVKSRHLTDIRVREFVNELWNFLGNTTSERSLSIYDKGGQS